METQAVNEADFGIPDVDGLKPRHQPILPGAPIALRTRLDVPLLVAALQPQHPLTRSSWNAGRYLCNYLYYLSLHRCRLRRVSSGGCDQHDAVFVHTPSFEQQPPEEQLRFLLDFLLALSAMTLQGVGWREQEEEQREAAVQSDGVHIADGAKGGGGLVPVLGAAGLAHSDRTPLWTVRPASYLG